MTPTGGTGVGGEEKKVPEKTRCRSTRMKEAGKGEEDWRRRCRSKAYERRWEEEEKEKVDEDSIGTGVRSMQERKRRTKRRSKRIREALGGGGGGGSRRRRGAGVRGKSTR